MGHLQLQLQAKRVETQDKIVCAQQDLEQAKDALQLANTSADETMSQAVQWCASQRRGQISEVHAAADGVEQFVDDMPFRERSMNNNLVEALGELCTKLRSG